MSLLGITPFADVQVQHEHHFVRLLGDEHECTNLQTSRVDWTITTGYILGAVALCLALVLWKTSPKRRDDRIMTCFFVMTSFAYGFGISTARLLSEKGAPPAFTERLAMGFIALQSMVLNYVGIRTTTSKLCARDLWAVLHVVNILIAVGLGSELSVLVNIPIVFYIMVIFLYQSIYKNKRVAFKFLGQGLVFSSFMFQLSQITKCGEEALANCFNKCFLPQPLAFSYLAVQNIIATIGIIVTAIGEILVPASKFYRPMSSGGGGANVSRMAAVPRPPTSLRSGGNRNSIATRNVDHEANETELRALSPVDEEVGSDSDADENRQEPNISHDVESKNSDQEKYSKENV